ncbi:MAG: hypothetical protein NWR50_04300 [Crocinitomicaceae bacterium]|jgi:hypothetical protein|nr:hypothetical protein [Crocinitomicaceae bacterium]
MKKLALLFVLVGGTAYGQFLSGAIIDEGRQMTSDSKFIVEGIKSGTAKFELSVDREGVVTGVRMLESTLKSTPAEFELKKYMKTFAFQKGTYYPKFHHVVVKMTVVRP